MAAYELNRIFLGEVASIQNYGAFVKIPGCSQQGLIHRSQVSSAHVDNVADVLQKGEKVWCKVISIDDDGKIGLSMKYVDQGSGKDLDSNGVSLQMDLQKKKSAGTQKKEAIKLQAVLNTTCRKCGTYGHLATDCFMSPDGKKYELIPEVEEKSTQPDPKEMQEASNKQEPKKSKKEKSSTSKRKHDTDTDNDSSDNNERKKKKKKKKKKHSKSKDSKKSKHSK